MNNPIFNMFGNGVNSMPMGNTPIGNFMSMMNQFNQFRQTFQGGGEQAQQQVQQMVNNGQISQNQLNNAIQQANQIFGMMNGGR